MRRWSRLAEHVSRSLIPVLLVTSLAAPVRGDWTGEEATGHSADTPNNLASGTQGFWGLAIATMVAQGRPGFDDKVADTIKE